MAISWWHEAVTSGPWQMEGFGRPGEHALFHCHPRNSAGSPQNAFCLEQRLSRDVFPSHPTEPAFFSRTHGVNFPGIKRKLTLVTEGCLVSSFL